MALVQAKVADRPTLLGDLLKHEYGQEHYYAREVKNLTVAEYAPIAPHGVEIGQVYADDGTILVAADVAGLLTDGTTPLFLFIDDTAYMDEHAAGALDYAVLKQGPAVVAREQLKFGDTLTEPQIDVVASVLESQGIKVVNQY